MSFVTIELIRCDICAWSCEEPGWFTPVRDLHLCPFCASTSSRGEIICGRHVVVMSGDSWACSCGQSFEGYRRALEPIDLLKLLDLAPNPVAASAQRHANPCGPGQELIGFLAS